MKYTLKNILLYLLRLCVLTFIVILADASIPFLDLTETFRKEGEKTVLHLAPVDYHLNPTGNKVMAEDIARFLLDGKFLE